MAQEEMTVAVMITVGSRERPPQRRGAVMAGMMVVEVVETAVVGETTAIRRVEKSLRQSAVQDQSVGRRVCQAVACW